MLILTTFSLYPLKDWPVADPSINLGRQPTAYPIGDQENQFIVRFPAGVRNKSYDRAPTVTAARSFENDGRTDAGNLQSHFL